MLKALVVSATLLGMVSSATAQSAQPPGVVAVFMQGDTHGTAEMRLEERGKPVSYILPPNFRNGLVTNVLPDGNLEIIVIADGKVVAGLQAPLGATELGGVLPRSALRSFGESLIALSAKGQNQ